MRYLVSVLILCSLVAADDSCLILKHASTSHQAFVSGANWQYVAGEFPPGMKWKSNVTDRYVRKIKGVGWKVVIVKTDYSVADLDAAKQECLTAKREGRTK